jgi:RNA polymerase sigma factor (sigma-70 family)
VQPLAAHPSAHLQQIESLYSDHHGWLQGWVRRKMTCSFDAADVAQDVFLRLLSRGEPVQAREPRAFLSTIARGLVIERWRRRELEQAWLNTLAALPESDAPSPENQLVFLQALIEIDRVLDALKPPVRQAFLLAQLDGLSCPQIAQQLGVSLATAERYLAKALRACYALRFEA